MFCMRINYLMIERHVVMYIIGYENIFLRQNCFLVWKPYIHTYIFRHFNKNYISRKIGKGGLISGKTYNFGLISFSSLDLEKLKFQVQIDYLTIWMSIWVSQQIISKT